MLPDIAVARSVLDELLLARIDDRHIHFLGQRDSLPPDLPEASFLQKSDFLHALRIGAFLGAGAGIAAGALLWFFPPQNLALEPVIILAVGLVGGVLGAWFSSMIGSSVPNTSLRAFQPEIEAGKVLLMVDVPFRRVEEIRDSVANHHPEAQWGGVAPEVPAFP
jgi:hypothetical protein